MTKLDSQRRAGQLAQKLHKKLAILAEPGTNLLTIEAEARDFFQKHPEIKPSFLNYRGYPSVLCLCLNEQIVHGIPKDRTLEDGDLLTIDLGVSFNGWHVDTARSYQIGSENKLAERLIEAADRALKAAIATLKPGASVNIIGKTVEKIVSDSGFFVIKELNGHGIGRRLQEPPTVPNYYDPSIETILETGVSIAIEPIIAARPIKTKLAADNWTIISSPKVLSVQVEDTIYIDKNTIINLTDSDNVFS